ncbi:insulin-like growth factor-binding protein 1a [Denticeps clupeoides]|uniref:insulin-like growth factor-binding protein 1a n=1 Tax=Denticeps clupeoides TaxID=299321 RepID=UPI0010A4DCCE|nr:insulin-like growth factor-binding protein 1 [Denticeps clupeoides]
MSPTRVGRLGARAHKYRARVAEGQSPPPPADMSRPMSLLSLLLLLPPLLLLARPAAASPLPPEPPPEPVRCAACSAERLAACPPVDPACPEALREPGCGCCAACAVRAGGACGFYTAPCGSGFRCVARPGEARPLHALGRGRGVCAPPSAPPSPTDATESRAGSNVVAAEAQESMKAKVNSIRRKLLEQGPCHVELQRAVEKISRSQQGTESKLNRFYLPNCDKHGLYKTKQCESYLDGQRGTCWCVTSWNGKRVPGLGDVSADGDCPQDPNH